MGNAAEGALLAWAGQQRAMFQKPAIFLHKFTQGEASRHPPTWAPSAAHQWPSVGLPEALCAHRFRPHPSARDQGRGAPEELRGVGASVGAFAWVLPESSG